MSRPTRDAEIAYPRAFERALLGSAIDVTELLLIRHGEVEPPRQDEPAALGPSLSPVGVWQTEQLAIRLKRERTVDAIYTSPLTRARQTAEVIGDRLSTSVSELYDLREVEFRCHADDQESGHCASPLSEEVYTRFEQTGRWDTFPEAELSRALRGRVRGAIDTILQTNACRRVAVISHAGVINAYLAGVFGIERDMFFLPQHASLSSVRVLGETRVIDRLNDITHLEPDAAPGQNYQTARQERQTSDAARRSRFASFYVAR